VVVVPSFFDFAGILGSFVGYFWWVCFALWILGAAWLVWWAIYGGLCDFCDFVCVLGCLGGYFWRLL